MRRMIILVIMLGLLVGMQPKHTAKAAQRCFTETNQCMYGRIAEFWEQNGGLAVFGLPIGPEEATTLDGNTFFMQRFERNRLELHPENARPYDVLLGRLGADRLKQRQLDWFSFPKSTGTPGCNSFDETGFEVCGLFLERWSSVGLQLDKKSIVTPAESLALFGLPLSGVMTETLSDGNVYQVQWFERARFELHPENPAPYNVQLGLLGNETTEWNKDSPIRLTVPSKRFTPFPQLGVRADQIASLGFRLSNWNQSWYGNPRFYSEFPDRGDMKKLKNLQNNAIQLHVTSATATTASGSAWVITIGLGETETIYDAKVHFETHRADELLSAPKQAPIQQYFSVSKCNMEWATGWLENRPTLVSNLQCKNKFANITIGGFGDYTELANLMEYLVDYYVNNL